MATKQESVTKKQKDTIVLDVEKDLLINKHSLDAECVSQPSYYFRYAEAAQQAKHRVGELEDRLKLIIAEQNIAIRNDFITQGTKFTESVIDAELTKDTKCMEARALLRHAQKEAATLAVAVSAFDHRRSSLDNLVKLYNSGYWAQPSGSRETGNDRTQQEIRRGLSKGKRQAPDPDEDEDEE